MLIAFAASFPLVFLLALTRTRLDNIAWGISATIFGIVCTSGCRLPTRCSCASCRTATGC